MLVNLLHGGTGDVHEIAVRRPSGQGLKAQRAATGEQVQAAGTVYRRCQPVKQGLPDAIRSGPQPFLGNKIEIASPPLTSDDAQLALLAIAFSWSCHFVALSNGGTIGAFADVRLHTL